MSFKLTGTMIATLMVMDEANTMKSLNIQNSTSTMSLCRLVWWFQKVSLALLPHTSLSPRLQLLLLCMGMKYDDMILIPDVYPKLTQEFCQKS